MKKGEVKEKERRKKRMIKEVWNEITEKRSKNEKGGKEEYEKNDVISHLL
jgi:hypothetical protein